MKLRFITDHISSTGLISRAGDVRDYPDGMAGILIWRKKAEAVREQPAIEPYKPKPKPKRIDP